MLASNSGITSAQASNRKLRAQNHKPQSTNLQAQTCTQRPAHAAVRKPVRGPDDYDNGAGDRGNDDDSHTQACSTALLRPRVDEKRML